MSDYFVNEQIRDKEVRVIGENGEQLGIMSSKEAYMLAKEADLDLIKIAPTAKPPVCKIADFGKFRYEQTRREKEAKKKQKVTEVKEIRLSPNIDDNDLTTKANQARKFLEHGDKVKASLKFRGREMAHMSNGKEILDHFAELLADVAVIDKAAKLEGRNMIMFLTQKK
ncbi:MAG: translation initiation factor IF-3 [Lachnospiraceae bacterium]|nr:translation initiation factor IF-3 [Lachnospiraceae bacterium]